MIERQVVTLEDGLAFATNQNNLLLELKGLSSAGDFIRDGNDKPPNGAFKDYGSMLSVIE
jgi:twitching motility protein PilT